MRNVTGGLLILVGCLCRAQSIGSVSNAGESGVSAQFCYTGVLTAAGATCSGTATIAGTSSQLAYNAYGLTSSYGSLGAFAQGSITPGMPTGGTIPSFADVSAISLFVDTLTFNANTTCGGSPCAATGSGTIQMQFEVSGTGKGPNAYCMQVLPGNNKSGITCDQNASLPATSSPFVVSQPLAITFGQSATFTVALDVYGHISDFVDSNGGFTVTKNSVLVGFVVKDSTGKQLTAFNLVSASGTAYPAATASAPPVILPQFVFGGGWYSALYFTNTSATAVSFTVNFTSDNGKPLSVPSVGGSSTIVSLTPQATAIIEAPNTGPLNQGYASVSLPDGVEGYGVFRQSIPGIADQEVVAPFSSGLSSASTLIWDDTNYTTAVAIVNPSASATTVNITLWDSNGNTIGTTPVALQPFAKTENALRAYPGLAAMVGQRGSAQFAVSTGAVAVLGLRFNGPAISSIPATQQ